jgi:S-adenosylmethionine-dependent methyltransferase
MLDKARQRLELLPAEAQQRVTLLQADGEASRRDPYRQVSRAFHLIGRKGSS